MILLHATQVLYIPSAIHNNGGSLVCGIDNQQNNALVKRGADIAVFVNQYGGSLIALGQSKLTNAYAWLPVKVQFYSQNFINVSVTPDIGTISNSSNAINLSHNAWHGFFYGPPDWSGEEVLLGIAKD